MAIVEYQMWGVIWSQSDPHKVLDAGTRANHRLGIQHIDHRLDGKQIKLRWGNHRQVIGGGRFSRAFGGTAWDGHGMWNSRSDGSIPQCSLQRAFGASGACAHVNTGIQ